MRSCSLSWKLFWLLPVAAGAQVPDVHFPEVDPLYSYPIPPLGLLGPKCDMDVVDVRYSESGEERQTLHIVVHQLANGVSRVTTTASVHGIPFKRPHHWRRWVHLPERLFIAPKKRLENAYHFKVVGDAYRVCTQRGRVKRPWETYTVADRRIVWDTIIHGDTLILQRVHAHFTDTTKSSVFTEIWSNGRLYRSRFGTRTQGSEQINMEHTYTYSGDSVLIVHRQPAHGKDERSTVAQIQRDAMGRPVAVSRTYHIPGSPSPERVRSTEHLLDYDQHGRITCMAEWNGDTLVRSLIMNYR